MAAVGCLRGVSLSVAWSDGNRATASEQTRDVLGKVGRAEGPFRGLYEMFMAVSSLVGL